MSIQVAPAPNLTVIEIASQEFLAVTTKPIDSVKLCKEYITINDMKLKCERRVKELKPEIDSIRDKSAKETFIPGKFRGMKGKYKINHIEKTQDYASVEVLQDWLTRGRITLDEYNQVVKPIPANYNLVSFQSSL